MAKIADKPNWTPDQAFEQLQVWYQRQEQLRALQASEVLLRKEIVAYYFPKSHEGTNRADIGGGYDVVAMCKLNRNVDEAALDAVKAPDIKKNKLVELWDDLFVFAPKLGTRAYRTLSTEQRKFVDGLLDISDATPSLKIVPSGTQSDEELHHTQANVKPARKKSAAKKTTTRKTH